MQAPDIVVGLDIGTTKIACLVGQRNENGKLEILGMGQSNSTGVIRGVVSNIEKTVNSIKEAVDQARESSGVDFDTVTVGVAGQHIKSIQHRGILTRDSLDDEISQTDVDNLIDDMNKIKVMMGQEIIHVIPQEFIVDNEQGIKNPIGMSGIRLEADFHIITGDIGAAKNIFKCVEKSGLKVADVILEPIASSESVLTDEEKEAGVVLVDIGGGTTDVAVFEDGIIRHTAVIPFGGNAITEDVKNGCTIIQKQAEQLKIKFGSALANESQENEIVCIPGLRGREAKEISLKNLANIIQARMEEIIEHVYYEIKNSGYSSKLACGIVVTGGGAQLSHTKQLFDFVTGMGTRIGVPNEHLASQSNDKLASPKYATSVGLVLKGFEELDHKNKLKSNTLSKSEEIIEPEKSAKKPKKGKFFETIMGFVKDLMQEDEIE